MKVTRLGALAVLWVLAGCATNPVTGRHEFALVSESQEISMGEEASKQVESSIGLVDNPALQDYVRRVGMRLAATSERPRLPWKFGVLDDPVPNAFALPGGPIYVTRGMMDLMNTEAELATVLGHEIGHITARHSVSQITKATFAQIGLGVASIVSPAVANFGGILSGGLQLIFLKYGRDAERQADELGFKYALHDNYDVGQMANVFRSLERVGEVEGKSGIPSWLSTHPDPGERIQTAERRYAALPAPPSPRIANRDQYLNHIDGLVYGENPRQGFFRGPEFLHPDMRFKLMFPTGWKTQNMPQSVIAVSPNEDAVIELTIAKGTPQQAANEFFKQQGIQPGQTSSSPINGNPALTGYFRAQTQQGGVEGLATFLTYGSNTFRLLGYSAASRFGTYDAVFKNSFRSFDTLTDPTALNVKPNRIDIVKLTSPMTLSQFNARYPSVIPMSQLAIINQVEDANSTVSGEVKRVVAE